MRLSRTSRLAGPSHSSAWSGALLVAALPFLAAGLGAQEPEEGPAERAQALVDLLQSLPEESPTPGVLSGIDLTGAPARQVSIEVKRIARALKETRVDLALEKQDLPRTVKLLSDLSGVAFVISRKARESIDADKPEVNLTARRLSVENAVNLLAVQHRDFRFTVRHGAVLVLHKDEYRPVKVTRIYPVHDLIRPRPDFPAPRLALGSPDDPHK